MKSIDEVIISEKTFEMKRSTIVEMIKMCEEIEIPKITYKEKQLDMANEIIENNKLLAIRIIQILDKILIEKG